MIALWLACTVTPKSTAPAPEPQTRVAPIEKPRHLDRFRPLPDGRVSSQEMTRLRVALGERLFTEAKLSSRGACSACHALETAGASPQVVVGHAGQPGPRSVLPIYNSALQQGQFWDGRAPTVEVSSAALIDEAQAMAALKQDPTYVEAFSKAFLHDDPALTPANVGVALGAYVRSLLSPGRFDAYLKGDPNALDAAERDGLEAFVDAGCATCHFGPVLGGNLLDGRKIPSLRNVTRTGPWLHDGRATSLAGLLKGGHEGPITDEQLPRILVFLKALEGSKRSAGLE